MEVHIWGTSLSDFLKTLSSQRGHQVWRSHRRIWQPALQPRHTGVDGYAAVCPSVSTVSCSALLDEQKCVRSISRPQLCQRVNVSLIIWRFKYKLIVWWLQAVNELQMNTHWIRNNEPQMLAQNLWRNIRYLSHITNCGPLVKTSYNQINFSATAS